MTPWLIPRSGWTAGASACGCYTCMRTPMTSQARVRPPRRSTSPRGLTSWWRPAPGASPARSSTRRWTGPDVLANIGEIRRQEMARAREILGVAAGLARLRRLRAARGGDPLPPLPEGWLRADRAGRRGGPVGQDHPAVPASRDDHLRRERRRIRTSRPRHVHQVGVAAFDAAGDPDDTPTLARPGSRSSSTTRSPSTGTGRSRWIGRWSRGASSRRTPSGS